jgi:deoxyadenosine/deoxycytidine kinase
VEPVLIIIEVIGLAGAGKSTLTRAMFETIPNNLGSYRLAKARSTIRILLSIFRALPLILIQGKTRIGIKQWYWLGHFEASIHDLNRRSQIEGCQVLILDQGPIFEFIAIKRYLLSGRYGDYLASVYFKLLQKFYASIDAVVYLQAPDSVLLERVMSRHSSHLLKNMNVDEQRNQMAFYRAEYNNIFSAATAAGVSVVTLDTQLYSESQMLNETLKLLAEQGVLL